MSVTIIRAGDRLVGLGGEVRFVHGMGGAEPWWLSGGIAAANCIAAYTPKGAASLEASYDNNAAPRNGLPDGTYDATLGVAPGWDAINGWQGDAASVYLDTGLTPTGNNWSTAVRYSGAAISDASVLMGVLCPVATQRNLQMMPRYTNNIPVIISQGAGRQGPVASGLASGVMGLAGPTIFLNGLPIVTTLWYYRGNMPTASLFVLAQRQDAAAGSWFGGTIQAIAIYNTVLTNAQMLAVSTAMTAL